MNFKHIKLIIIISFQSVFATSAAFTQSDTIKYPSVHLIERDTVICFTIDQGKKLAKQNEERKYLIEDNKLLQKQNKELQAQIDLQSKMIANCDTLQTNYDSILKQKDDLQKICEEEKNALRKEVKRQRRRKIIAIGGGVLATSFMGYLYITK